MIFKVAEIASITIYRKEKTMSNPDKTNEKLLGIVIEFKVINQRKENSLEETVAAALKQIEEKN